MTERDEKADKLVREGMEKLVDKTARESVVEYVTDPIEAGDEEVILADVFDESIGKHWPQKLDRELKSARKEVIDELREREVNPMTFQNPVEMLVHTVAIRVLEELLVAADIYEDVDELREESDYVGAFEEEMEDQEEESESDDGDIWTPEV